MVQAEEVLERRVMNDQFWYPLGFSNYMTGVGPIRIQQLGVAKVYG